MPPKENRKKPDNLKIPPPEEDNSSDNDADDQGQVPPVQPRTPPEQIAGPSTAPSPPRVKDYFEGLPPRRVKLLPGDRRFKKHLPDYVPPVKQRPVKKKTLENYIKIPLPVGTTPRVEPPRDLSDPSHPPGKRGRKSKHSIENRDKKDRLVKAYQDELYKKRPKKAAPVPLVMESRDRPTRHGYGYGGRYFKTAEERDKAREIDETKKAKQQSKPKSPYLIPPEKPPSSSTATKRKNPNSPPVPKKVQKPAESRTTSPVSPSLPASSDMSSSKSPSPEPFTHFRYPPDPSMLSPGEEVENNVPSTLSPGISPASSPPNNAPQSPSLSPPPRQATPPPPRRSYPPPNIRPQRFRDTQISGVQTAVDKAIEKMTDEQRRRHEPPTTEDLRDQRLSLLSSEILSWTHARQIRHSNYLYEHPDPEHLLWDILVINDHNGRLRVVMPDNVLEAIARLDDLIKEKKSLSKRETRMLVEFLRSLILQMEYACMEAINGMLVQMSFVEGSPLINILEGDFESVMNELSTGSYGKLQFPEIEKILLRLCDEIKRVYKNSRMTGVPMPHFQKAKKHDPQGIITAEDMKMTKPKNKQLSLDLWIKEDWEKQRKAAFYGDIFGVDLRYRDFISFRPGGSLTYSALDATAAILSRHPSTFIMPSEHAHDMFENIIQFNTMLHSTMTSITNHSTSVNRIIIPLQVGDVWFCVVVDLNGHNISVYDPRRQQGDQLSPQEDNKELLERLRLIRRLITNVRSAGWGRNLPPGWPNTLSFTSNPILGPSETNSDSGMLVAMYIELLLNGQTRFLGSRSIGEREDLSLGVVDSERVRIGTLIQGISSAARRADQFAATALPKPDDWNDDPDPRYHDED